MRKTGLLISSAGIGAGIWYALNVRSERKNERRASMAPADDADRNSQSREVLDDQGTDQTAAAEILRNVRDRAFDSSDEKLALALGRPTEEIAEWTRGARSIDADVVMKARALAQERGAPME
jgi:uncharacterized protein HemX